MAVYLTPELQEQIQAFAAARQQNPLAVPELTSVQSGTAPYFFDPQYQKYYESLAAKPAAQRQQAASAVQTGKAAELTPFQKALLEETRRTYGRDAAVSYSPNTQQLQLKTPSGTRVYTSLERRPGEEELWQQLKSMGLERSASDIRSAPDSRISQAKALVQDVKTQEANMKRQAEQHALATQMLMQASMDYQRAMDQIQQGIPLRLEELNGAWERALAKADEIVASAARRSMEAYRQIDQDIAQMRQSLSFEKAHSLQTAVHSLTDQFDHLEAQIAAKYGANSPEMLQFKQNKQLTIANTQSQIHTAFGQLRAQLDAAAGQLRSDTIQRMAMYENYNEQAALDVYKAAAQASNAYALEAAQLRLAAEQYKMNNQTMLAEWIVNTPVFSISYGSLASALATLLPSRQLVFFG